MYQAHDYAANGTQAKAFKAWFGDWEHDPANASKVVDADGAPQATYGDAQKRDMASPVTAPKVLYHGTTHGGFRSFDRRAQAEDGFMGPGFYFTEDPDLAHSYAASENGEVKSVYLNIKNPYDADAPVPKGVLARLKAVAKGQNPYSVKGGNDLAPSPVNGHQLFGALARTRGAKTAVELLRRAGFDGIFYEGTAGKPESRVWVAFKPNQIKAVDNMGSFSSGSDDIYKAHASGYPLQGRMKFQGLDISIENRKGSTRVDKHNDPPQWKTKMLCHYGYIRNSEGVDHDHIDCFVGPNLDATHAYIVRQVVPETGKTDEEKVMLGFDNIKQAKAMYLRHYDSPKFFGGIKAMPMEEFKTKVLATLPKGGGLVKALSPADQKAADAETARIKENAAKPEAKKPHTFKAAKWTHPNGHPRCLICGDEEPTGGRCNMPDEWYEKQNRREAVAAFHADVKRKIGQDPPLKKSLAPKHRGLVAKLQTRKDGHKQKYWVKPAWMVPKKSAAVQIGRKTHHGLLLSHPSEGALPKVFIHIPGIGTHAADARTLKPSSQKVVLKNDLVPKPGTWVNVQGEKSVVRRQLVTPLSGKGDKSKITVRAHTPGRRGIPKDEIVLRSQILGAYIPQKTADTKTGERTTFKTAAVLAPADRKKVTAMEYPETLSPAKKKIVAQEENAWLGAHNEKVSAIAARVANQWPGADAGQIEAAAYEGALYGLREWLRKPKELRAALLDSMAKKSKNEDKAAALARLKSEYSDPELRDHHCFVRCHQRALRVAKREAARSESSLPRGGSTPKAFAQTLRVIARKAGLSDLQTYVLDAGLRSNIAGSFSYAPPTNHRQPNGKPVARPAVSGVVREIGRGVRERFKQNLSDDEVYAVWKSAIDALRPYEADFRELMRQHKDGGVTKSLGLRKSHIKAYTRKDGVHVPAHSDKRTKKPDAPAALQPLSPQEDYHRNGTRSHAFKQWFGDWQHDSANASKVVDKDGAPQQNYGDTKPKRLYHGTSRAGFQSFDKNRQDKSALYGPGFYFTEDEEIAASYQEKGGRYELEQPITPAIMAKAKRWIESKSAYKEAMSDVGIRRSYQILYSAISAGPEALAAHLAEHPHEQKMKQWGLTRRRSDESEVKACYLNIRNPIDADKPLPVEVAEKIADSFERLYETTPTHSGKTPRELFVSKARAGATFSEAIAAVGNYVIASRNPETKSYRPLSTGNFQELLQASGFDGITHIGGNNMGDKEHRVWIAFEPNQIKSVDNEGTFSPTDDNMYKGLNDGFQKSQVRATTRHLKSGKAVPVKAYSDKRTKKVAPLLPLKPARKVASKPTPQASPSATISEEEARQFTEATWIYEDAKEWRALLNKLPRVDPSTPNADLKKPSLLRGEAAREPWNKLAKMAVAQILNNPKHQPLLAELRRRDDESLAAHAETVKQKQAERAAARDRALDEKVGKPVYNGETDVPMQRIPDSKINYYAWNSQGKRDNNAEDAFSGGDYRVAEPVGCDYGGGISGALLSRASQAKAKVVERCASDIKKIEAAGFANVRLVFSNRPPGDGAPGRYEALIVFDDDESAAKKPDVKTAGKPNAKPSAKKARREQPPTSSRQQIDPSKLKVGDWAHLKSWAGGTTGKVLHTGQGMLQVQDVDGNIDDVPLSAVKSAELLKSMHPLSKGLNDGAHTYRLHAVRIKGECKHKNTVKTRVSGPNGVKHDARICADCGHLQLFDRGGNEIKRGAATDGGSAASTKGDESLKAEGQPLAQKKVAPEKLGNETPLKPVRKLPLPVPGLAHPIRKSFQETDPFGESYPLYNRACLQTYLNARPALLKALRDDVLMKSGNQTASQMYPGGVPKDAYKNPKAHGLRWITAHPGGTGDGVPLLVHDNGEQYTVVGGAGGKMNQQVFKKPKNHDDPERATKKARRQERNARRIEAVKKEFGEDYEKAEEKKRAINAEVKQQSADLLEKAREMVGAHLDEGSIDLVKKEAEKRARKENPSASEDEIKEFAETAAKEHKDQAREIAQQVINKALEKAALRALGDDDGEPAEIKAQLSGKQLVKKLSDEQIKELVEHQVSISHLKNQAKAISRALKAGDQETLQGIDAAVKPLENAPDEKELSEAARKYAVDEWTKAEDVAMNTALVLNSEMAPTTVQRRHQAAGSADGLNAFVSSHHDNAILDSDTVHQLGVENAARVAAAYMKANGTDAKATAEGLRERIANDTTASIKAVMDNVEDMDKIVQGAKDAANSGDGTVSKSQASIVAATMAKRKYNLLNTARGQLRGAAALAHHLEHPSAEDMVVAAGASRVGARAKATGLGLGTGDYSVERAEGGGYAIKVKAGSIGKMARPHSTAEAASNQAMDELKADVAENPGKWRAEGFREDAALQPHQELAARALIDNKRMVWNMGAGCIDAATEIHDPVRNLTRTVHEWMEHREAPNVWALNDAKQSVIAQASVPFMKAFEMMYEVKIGDSKSITVAAGHKFLTQKGWVPIREIAVGDHVAVSSPASHSLTSPSVVQASVACPALPPQCSCDAPATTCARSVPSTPPRLSDALHPRSIADTSLLGSFVSAPHSSQTPQDSLGGCRQGYRSCDAQLLEASTDGQVPVPSRSDARGYNRCCLHQDDQGGAVGCNPICPSSAPPSTMRSAPLPAPPVGAPQEYRGVCGTREPTLHGNQNDAQSGCHSSSPLPTAQSLLCGDEAEHKPCTSSCVINTFTESNYNTTWEPVVDVKQAREAFVYDLEVYEHHNYLAHGIWNHNSGKTPTMHAAMAHLLSTGKIDKGIITMPSKPRAQQDGPDGELAKFLTPEMAEKYAVIKDGADLKRQLEAVKNGSKQVLVMSPQLMREKTDDLLAAGFGGERSAYIADEAHEFAIGGHEKGSGMAKAARKLAGSEYMAAASGTLIENNASELHSLYELVHPGSLGPQKKFTQEWQRLAQGGNNLFASESMRGMRNKLAGGMVSYHKATTRKTADGGEEAVKLERNTVTVKASPEQKAAIKSINERYKKDRASDNPEVFKAAALKRRAATMRVLNGPDNNPKHEVVKQIVADEKKRDPKNRVGVFAQELKPLRGAAKHIGKNVVSITGAEDDKATQNSIKQLNDRTNDVDGVAISSAGNYGVNLVGMDHLVKLHALDTPSKEDQLDHRHFRGGQTRDVRATTVLTDSPEEQLTQYRTTKVKLPEVALLAMLADDSHHASALAGSYNRIKNAAQGNAAQGA